MPMTRRAATVLTAIVLLAVCATPAEAATLYAFTAQEVYVRNDRGAFVIGTARGPAYLGEGRRHGQCCEAAGKGGRVRPYTLFLKPR